MFNVGVRLLCAVVTAVARGRVFLLALPVLRVDLLAELVALLFLCFLFQVGTVTDYLLHAFEPH